VEADPEASVADGAEDAPELRSPDVIGDVKVSPQARMERDGRKEERGPKPTSSLGRHDLIEQPEISRVPVPDASSSQIQRSAKVAPRPAAQPPRSYCALQKSIAIGQVNVVRQADRRMSASWPTSPARYSEAVAKEPADELDVQVDERDVAEPGSGWGARAEG
jgi:hypothetical protein